MKIATWNVNSVRARLDRLVAWLGREQPDIVCLQELKVADAAFPRAELEAAGWHAAIIGQKTYNGVGVLARTMPEDVRIGMTDGGDDSEARLISARVGGVRVISAYIPNGKYVGSDTWPYKLEWLKRLRAYLDRSCDKGEDLALCGDFNIAPEDRDVARPDEWRGSTLFHEELSGLLGELIAWGLVDTIRLHHTGEGPYTWWDYRMLGFAKGNGLRIDHILATAPLAARCTAAYVARDERKGKLPSDHAPVVAVFSG
jgi:exodeoxyribonuclease-3